MSSKLSRWCDGLLEAGWLAAVVATPLFFNIHSSRVFEPDKLTLLRSIAVFMTVAWLVKFVDSQGWRSLGWLRWRSENSIWRMPFVGPVLLLVIVYLLSTVFSVTPSVSLAGSYQRLQGTYTTLSYITIFTLMAATMRRREQVSRVVTAAIITSIPVALYGVLQHYGSPDPLPWGGNVQRRVAGHMGNSIFIGAYLIMVLPLTAARIIDAFTNILSDEELDVADVVRASIYIFTLAIQIMTLIWSWSRGPFLGFVASIFAFVLILLVTLRNAAAGETRIAAPDIGRALLLALLGTLVPFILATTALSSALNSIRSFAFFIGAVFLLVVVILVLAVARRGWRWLWLSWIVLALALTGFLVVFNASEDMATTYAERPVVGGVTDTLASWTELPQIGRFSQLLESGSGTGKVRVLIWNGVLDLIGIHEPLESPFENPDQYNFLRPVLGYGPESMYVAYNRFYQPELATIEARNASPDRSHNETFDALVITGGAGLLAWQLLYLSVFYYAFRWLGVVRSNMDRNILIGLWIAGGVVAALVIVAWQGMAFVGVAIPFGTIIGLILYLFYYALFTRGVHDDDVEADPFGVDRLLLIGLVAAVLAHYVEIHFGIAIAATRTYFFVYLGLLFVVGYLLPRLKEEPEEEAAANSKGRRRKRARRTTTQEEGWLPSVLAGAFVLAMIVAILSYNFMTTSLPQLANLQELRQLPAAADFIHHSFFVSFDPQKNPIDSPFIYLLIMLSWTLGGLVMLSELAKRGKIGLSLVNSPLKKGRMQAAGTVFVGMLVLSAVSRFLLRPDNPGLTRQLGEAFILIWAAMCLLGAILLFRRHEQARLVSGIIAAIGLIFALPVYGAGSILQAIILAIACITILYLIWDSAWNELISPALVMGLLSLAAGLFYAYIHAATLRANYIRPAAVTDSMPLPERRVLETLQTLGVLSTFYVFIFSLLLVLGLSLAWHKMSQVNKWGSWGGLVASLILLPAAVFVISTTNVQVIHADMLYKRGEPFDQQATRNNDVQAWDIAIAIYEKAIDIAPHEDFYYLMLGRAYLERASLTADQQEREELLDRAEVRLLEAQQINPLNTDHTANLARLNTRRADTNDEQEKQSRIEIASGYYEKAMTLSPQNAVIMNEYARLAFALEDDCDHALELYNLSAERDPFYKVTYFDRAQAYLDCAQQQPEEQREGYYQSAAESAQGGLDQDPGDPRGWLLLAESQIMLGDIEEALVSYESAVEFSNNQYRPWRIDLIMSERFASAENLDRAVAFAQSALEQAPENVSGQIQQFLSRLLSVEDEAG